MDRTLGDQLQRVLTTLTKGEGDQLERLSGFLAIESVGADSTRKPDMREAAEWLVETLQRMGIQSRVHATPLHPIVTGEWLDAGRDRPTILIYGHYDVQPVDPIEQWESPPFMARISDGRLYARGASDDKGQVFMHLAVLGAYLETLGKLPINVRLLFEGEEEIGSPSLPRYLEDNAARLSADYAVISDTPMFAVDVPAVGYALRGMAYLQITLRGADRDLHSGQFGGMVPNPLNALVGMLSTLHNPDGSVAVAGFYDTVDEADDLERKQIASLPFDAAAVGASLGLDTLPGEASYSPLERLWTRPTLDVNGIWGGYSGEGAKTVIPAMAAAKLSCRLVPRQDYKEIAALVMAHLKQLVPAGIQCDVTLVHGGQPYIGARDHPVIDMAREALRTAFGAEPVFQRDGGTIPAVPLFAQVLGLESMLLPFGLPDENKHAPNEWLSLDNYRRGLVAIASLWWTVGEAWRTKRYERRS